MSTKPHEKPVVDEQNQARQQLRAGIGRQILRVLGQPADFQAVHVRPLWENRYRANVLVGTDCSSLKIAHSYFVEADGEGVIITSTPPITKVYEAAKSDAAQKQ